MITLFMTLVIFSASSVAIASTEAICRDAGSKVRNSTEIIQACSKGIAKRLGPVKTEIETFYDALKNKNEECAVNGGDCAHYKIRITSIDKSGVKTFKYQEVDLTRHQEDRTKSQNDLVILARLANQKCLEGVESKGYTGCLDKLAGFQNATSDIVKLSTLFISSILPAQTLHVDSGDLLSGKPFGGDSAVTMEIRESLLNMTGMPDFMQNYIRDPINVSQNVIKDIAKYTADLLNDICGDVCGGLNVRF